MGKNCRPVSHLTFVYTLLQRLDSLHVQRLFGTNHALPITQSAYRKFHSTESDLLKAYSDLCFSFGKGHIVLLRLLDRSSAFDIVDHEILLKYLESSYGITGAPLSWMWSYITDREQSVNVCSAKSLNSTAQLWSTSRMITTTGCSTDSFAFVCVMPPRLLQLVNCRTAVM